MNGWACRDRLKITSSPTNKGGCRGAGIGAPGARHVGEHVVVRVLEGDAPLFVVLKLLKKDSRINYLEKREESIWQALLAKAQIQIFTEYLASAVYGRVEQDPKLIPSPVSCRVGNQLRGLYGFPSGNRITRRFRKAPRVTDIVARGQLSGSDQ